MAKITEQSFPPMILTDESSVEDIKKAARNLVYPDIEINKEMYEKFFASPVKGNEGYNIFMRELEENLYKNIVKQDFEANGGRFSFVDTYLSADDLDFVNYNRELTRIASLDSRYAESILEAVKRKIGEVALEEFRDGNIEDSPVNKAYKEIIDICDISIAENRHCEVPEKCCNVIFDVSDFSYEEVSLWAAENDPPTKARALWIEDVPDKAEFNKIRDEMKDECEILIMRSKDGYLAVYAPIEVLETLSSNIPGSKQDSLHWEGEPAHLVPLFNNLEDAIKAYKDAYEFQIEGIKYKAVNFAELNTTRENAATL